MLCRTDSDSVSREFKSLHPQPLSFQENIQANFSIVTTAYTRFSKAC